MHYIFAHNFERYYMKISPISAFTYKKINFKGNNGSDPIKQNSPSLQNNGPEVKISSDISKILLTNSFEKELKQQIAAKDNDVQDAIFKDGEFNAAELESEAFIDSLNVGAKIGFPENLKGKCIPKFIKYSAANCISNMEKSIEVAKVELGSIDLPSMDNLPDFDFSKEMSLEQLVQLSNISKFMALFEMIENREHVLELLKTTKKARLQKAMDNLSDAMNAQLYNAILHGFDRNARAAFADLSANIEMYDEPEIIDNNNGTLTYLFDGESDNESFFIIKNKSNGDYISAHMNTANTAKAFDIYFNPDGTIKKLNYFFGNDDSILSLSQNDNRVISKHTSGNMVDERSFILTPEKELKLTSVRAYKK